MPHLATASLGIWAGAGSRDEEADEHGISHLLEHMAFKGTKRRSARAIAEEIEAVGGDINAATSVEHTTYNARVLARGRAARHRRAVRHPRRAGLRSGGADARAQRHRAGDRRRPGHAGRPRLRPVPGARLPRPADRPFHPRHAAERALLRAGSAAHLSRPQLPGAEADRRRRRRGGPRFHRRRGGSGASAASGARTSRRRSRVTTRAASRSAAGATWSRRIC